MKFGKAVIYNGGAGKEKLYGVVFSQNANGNLNVRWWDLETGESGYATDVPRRDTKDYGPEGGGHTWRPA